MTLKCKICGSRESTLGAASNVCSDIKTCRDRKIAQLKKELRRARKFIKMLQEGRK